MDTLRNGISNSTGVSSCYFFFENFNRDEDCGIIKP